MFHWPCHSDCDGIQQKLKSMTVDPVVNPLVMALNNGLSTRFRNMFDDESYQVGTMLILKFKLRYLPESDRQVKKLVLTQAVCALDREKQSVLPEAAATAIQPTPQRDSESTDTDDLFAFITDDTSLPSASSEDVTSSMKLTATCQMLM